MQAVLLAPSAQASLQLENALRQAPAQSSPGAGLLEELAGGVAEELAGGVAEGLAGASPGALTRVAMGGGEA